jgi:hypothetical protein
MLLPLSCVCRYLFISSSHSMLFVYTLFWKNLLEADLIAHPKQVRAIQSYLLSNLLTKLLSSLLFSRLDSIGRERRR